MADKGIVLFYDWLDVLKDIPPQEFKKMVLAIAEFRQNNTPPPTFNGKAKYIAPLIFGQLKTSMQKSSAGKLGAQGKWALSENSANGTSDGTPNGNANGRPAPCANSNANDQEQEQ
ncbi:MAG: hypothetical protein IJX39_08875 [Clostridia bacterium]|nr:hypothetical protein [Clostridia bacterium]